MQFIPFSKICWINFVFKNKKFEIDHFYKINSSPWTPQS